MSRPYKAFGEALAQLRRMKSVQEGRDIKQAEVARICNIQPGTIWQYESGVTKPGIVSLVRLANYYEISIDELITPFIDLFICGDTNE